MSAVSKFLLRLGHIVWLAWIPNISLGFFISGFHPFAQTISAVALQAPAFAYSHRALDIIAGVCMCSFGVGLNWARSGTANFSMVVGVLAGASFIAGGIWTLQSPLHELHGLSIVIILVPVTCALELRGLINSRRFDSLSLTVSLLGLLYFWCSYQGFLPEEFHGLIQRLWTMVALGWFGLAAYVVERQASSALSSTPRLGEALAAGKRTSERG